MAFECKHCGQCCIDECTQINISIGDIVRISKFLNCNMSDVMKRMGIKPFSDSENPNNFDYELGLNIPCEFRKGEQCSIYPARPLNCRMFPYVFIGNVDNPEEFIDPSHKCISEGITITPEEKEKYHNYAKFIGMLILEEGRMTDEFYEQNKLKQSNILPAYIFPAEDPNDIMHAKEITKSKIKMAMSMMDESRYANLKNQLQNFIMRKEKEITSLDEINNKEKEILQKL